MRGQQMRCEGLFNFYLSGFQAHSMAMFLSQDLHFLNFTNVQGFQGPMGWGPWKGHHVPMNHNYEDTNVALKPSPQSCSILRCTAEDHKSVWFLCHLPERRREWGTPVTSAGAVLDLVVEELGEEDHVCEDVEHHSDHLKDSRGKHSTSDCTYSQVICPIRQLQCLEYADLGDILTFIIYVTY